MSEAVRALIFDMDGTIVDNMRYHDDAWEIWHRDNDLPFARDGFFAATAGKANAEILSAYFPDAAPDEIARLSELKEELYRDTYRPHVAPLAGLPELMLQAEAAKIPMAVATAAPPGNVDLVLDALSLRPRFATVVSPSQGYRGKPHPDMFLAAAERMKVKPAQCLVFEDAPLGVEAAKNAGMRAVAMLTMLDAKAFSAFDNVVATAKDFSALERAELLRFV